MQFAANELYDKYSNNKELIVFTSMDFENFYETKWNLANWLDPTKGEEIQKTRPGTIVNDDSLGKLPLRIIDL